MSTTNVGDALAEEVLRLDESRYRAMTAGNADLIESLLDAELVYTHSSGFTDTRDDYLKGVRSGNFVYGPIDHTVAKVMVEGSVVMVFGEMHTEAVINGVKKTLDNISMSVWRLVRGEPRLVALQTTPLARR
ncbi:hypothetical protein B7R21_17370 [Subtercola boreus]|uniref:DUF4440 domain-containing protein n=1 Tax=Subtercola boreus TaxID=120213 RepID=A0A3E0VBI1_9MICO|nr:nuclear transport factor 2 family protein [Subtercola boreus]RFA06995.1 hypothetical protein B7R21_17370 [Subtercola boreus]